MTTVIEVQERPILFKGDMVRAILENRKTQTRRLRNLNDINANPDVWHFCALNGRGNAVFTQDEKTYTEVKNPYGVPGERRWVRETLRRDYSANIWYYAAGKPEDWVTISPANHTASLVWAHHKEGDVCVSIHMPRWASRLTLEIVKVRVERVQDISGFDCLAEGIPEHGGNSSDGEWRLREAYRKLWDSINEKRGFGWGANPFVWVIEFKRIKSAVRGASQ